MNLIIPINLQALRVAPNDASKITKNSDYFSGPTTSFYSLPWRDASYTEITGRYSKANIASNIYNPLSGNVTEQLNAGVHLHWALPDSLTAGIQQAEGPIDFPAVPNRFLVTRVMRAAGKVSSKQWVVESDYLMTEEEYLKEYFPQSGRKCVSLPVGWDILAGHDPQKDGGALYYPPFRRMGKVFELSHWQPVASSSGGDLTKVLHLEDFFLTAGNLIAPNQPLGPLKAVGPSGPTFAAYYPDSSSLFGFHDTFNDLPGESNLDCIRFQVSYQVTGWHSQITQDPLQTPDFKEAFAKAGQENDVKAGPEKLSRQDLLGKVIWDRFHWYYNSSSGEPERCLYGGLLAGLPWDTTGSHPQPPDRKAGFPQCYLAPSNREDKTVRIAVGNSTSSSLAALIKEEWKTWAGGSWKPAEGETPEISDFIEKDLECLLDALQMGLLPSLGQSCSLPQLEQALHQSAFGSRQGGGLWEIRKKESSADLAEADGHSKALPLTLPKDADDLAEKLDRLNNCQRQMDDLLNVIVSCRSQIFYDWYKYITTLFPVKEAALKKDELNRYLSGEILDLWAKSEAAFGIKTDAFSSGKNIPVFYSDSRNYIAFDSSSGFYTSPSPPSSLAGKIVEEANAVLQLLTTDYPLFELQCSENIRYWEPNDPIIVATGDSLKPAKRNGSVKYLPCRVSGTPIRKLTVEASSAASSLAAADMTASLGLSVPDLTDKTTPDAQSVTPLLEDLKDLLGEAGLIDPTLAGLCAAMLKQEGKDNFLSDLESAFASFFSRVSEVWTQGVPKKADPPVPGILEDQTIAADTLKVTWSGQAPQGLALTSQNAADWTDPFLPLFLVWTAEYTPFRKGSAATSAAYEKNYLTGQFQLDDNFLELIFGASPPKLEDGSITFSGSVSLSSKAAQPLYEQIQNYLTDHPDESPGLQNVLDYLKTKPLLSQGLSGTNAAMQTLEGGLSLTPFNPFYDEEAIPRKLTNSSDNFLYQNSLTYFAAWGAGGHIDLIPGGETLTYNLLRAGALNIKKADVVDVFGRKQTIINPDVPQDQDKILPSWQLKSPSGMNRKMYLPPRIAQPSRLRFRWLSAEKETMELNSSPASSPVCAWIVPNHLDNSLLFFTGEGIPLGSLGVFGGQQTVSWQSVAGNPPRRMEEDLNGANPALIKVAEFLFGRDRGFFQDLSASIENAHTYILPDDKKADQAQAVLMGRPLALLKVGLRLEVMGLPGFDSRNASLAATLSSESDKVYDWTKRDCAAVQSVNFPVRLGDRNHLEDGLVAYFLDSPDPYQVVYAPAAMKTGDTAVVRPVSDTLTLQLHADIDPPEKPYGSAADQVNDLLTCRTSSEQTVVTLLMDPRAKIHASMGILPVKAIDLPPDIYAEALRAIEVAFFTHPVLRGVQKLQLPLPREEGFLWNWTTGVLKEGTEEPVNEELKQSAIGDRAHFSYSPQIIQDGWLKLKPGTSPPDEDR